VVSINRRGNNEEISRGLRYHLGRACVSRLCRASAGGSIGLVDSLREELAGLSSMEPGSCRSVEGLGVRIA